MVTGPPRHCGDGPMAGDCLVIDSRPDLVGEEGLFRWVFNHVWYSTEKGDEGRRWLPMTNR